MNKLYIIGISVIITVLLIMNLFPAAFNFVDQAFLNIEYQLKGESKIDTSIVILYLSNNEIEALGGLPLKRTYYALVINALKELGVRAIGIDIAYYDANRKHPEYDILLSLVIKNAGNVVLSGYFRSVGDVTHDTNGQTIPELFTYQKISGTSWQKGSKINLPYSELLTSTQSIGHTHLIDESRVPLFIQSDGHLMPSFALEVFRLGIGVQKTDIVSTPSFLNVKSPAKEFLIPIGKDGITDVNIIGGKKSLNMISIVDFLKSYDNMKMGMKPVIPIENLHDKIVLVGIIAEGRSKFLYTPYDEEFPSIGIHAMFIHNALHNNFTVKASPFIEYLLIFIIGVLCVLAMQMKQEVVRLMGIVLIIFLYLLVLFILFSTNAYILPATSIFLTVILITGTAFIYQHRTIRHNVNEIVEEKKNLYRILEDKEAKLKKLEDQLAGARGRNIEDDRIKLEQEIKRYHDEVNRLKSLSEDLQPLVLSEKSERKIRKDYAGIIYESSGSMEEVVSNIQKVADNDVTVLILGESGTGKELVARALHEHSNRKNKPFIAVNCGALTETLLESELFGHEKGAFTGALKEKVGRFELADGGTILLDEIGEVSEAFQVKLLRVLQDGTFDRVGGIRTKKVDVRVIAATNKDLKQEVANKSFREDLYYRLNVFTIKIPPLRERTDDLPILVEHFLMLEDPAMKCSAGVMNIFKQYSWKGNVRELQSVIKRAVLLAKSEGRNLLRIKDIPEEITSEHLVAIDLEEQIIELLREKEFSHNSISFTADAIGGLNRGTIAEYFRGYCFKIFYESNWNLSNAVQTIANTTNLKVHNRVEKKLIEYLQNAIKIVDHSKTIEEVILLSKPKYKNLPQKYHRYLDDIITSYYKKIWESNK